MPASFGDILKKAVSKMSGEQMDTTGLEAIQGVGKGTAEVLWEAGIRTPEHLARTDATDLTQIQGIGRATAKKLVAAANKHIEAAKATSPAKKKSKQSTTSTKKKQVKTSKDSPKNASSKKTKKAVKKTPSKSKPIASTKKKPAKKGAKKTTSKNSKKTTKIAKKATKKPTVKKTTTKSVDKPKKAKASPTPKKTKKKSTASTKKKPVKKSAKKTTSKSASTPAKAPEKPKLEYVPKKKLEKVTIQDPGKQPWVAERSKIKAAIENGLPQSYLRVQRVLYLGAAHGYTISHIHDKPLELYAVEKSREMMQHFLPFAANMPSVYPIFADASAPDSFAHLIPAKVDVVFQDIAQRDQVGIFLSNCERFLAPHGVGILALKARNVNSTAEPAAIFAETRQRLEQGGATIVQEINLEPSQEGHKIFVVHMSPLIDW